MSDLVDIIQKHGEINNNGDTVLYLYAKDEKAISGLTGAALGMALLNFSNIRVVFYIYSPLKREYCTFNKTKVDLDLVNLSNFCIENRIVDVVQIENKDLTITNVPKITLKKCVVTLETPYYILDNCVAADD